jgi:predicted HTH transcriptional regulator
MPDLDSEAVDFRAASESFLPVRKLARRDLETLGLMTAHQGAEIGAVRRKERWSLPPVAVREAIVNAVVHADYAQRGAPIRVSVFHDRLEVESPGLLPFGLTVDDVRRGISKLRNRVIGRVFHELGLIEQWGSRIQRMAAACHDLGLAAPVLEELGTLSTQEVAAAIDLTPRAARTRLAKLVDRGMVREIGTNPQDPRRRYFRTEETTHG